MSDHYQIRQFAELAGVTVKALHHYDRLGLLRPKRSRAGYRVYYTQDLETLEQIVALKFLGLPLKQIGAVLKRPALKWRDTLRLQRDALEERRELLGRAIRAITIAEEATGPEGRADTGVLKKVIEVIGMQNNVEAMKKYYADESWEQYRRYYEEGPSAEWRKLYSDAKSLLGDDPVSPAAQELVARWNELARRAHSGDPEALTDSPEAWMDRANWPETLQARAAELGVEKVRALVQRAEFASRKQFFSDQAWEKLTELTKSSVMTTTEWKARAELFRELEEASGEDPAGERAQALVARWKEQLERVTGGDAEITQAMLNGWSHRKQWPESQRWRVERLHLMTWERFEKAADFLDRAREAKDGRELDALKGAPQPMLKERLIKEFDEEMLATRRMLERVPGGEFSWRPHERAFTLGKLANHVAAIPGIASVFLRRTGGKPPEAETKADLLAVFDKNVHDCREQLA
ncbi:MAG: MerR family transcriptional regulator, partial [Acidobacteriia bacterium]|nr:MerR family transcriptional regulator [Terriglobia bacterium]